MIKANEGHTVLNWTEGQLVTLYKSSDPNFENQTLIYKGSKNSFFITGMSNGLNYFRIISENGEQASVTVSVSYPEKKLVIFSLIIGTFLFLSLVLIIFLGNRKYGNTATDH